MEIKFESAQTRDQAGFRNEFSCDDHLFVVTMLMEKSNEIGQPCWIATLDFKKAFDTIEHEALWKALESQDIPACYINVLKALYTDQTARVQTDAASRTFSIHRGTKQGDPISPTLFNAVVEEFMKTVKKKWKDKGWGVQLGSSTGEKLTNLRFADDILITARTLPQIKKMLQDVSDAAKEVGLGLHPDKTKILHNNVGYGVGAKTTVIGNMSIEVLDKTQKAMYLGRMLKPTEMQEEELKNRTSKAWAKYNIHKADLTNDKLPIGLRLKLFNATVTPTMLYGSGSWVLTEQMRSDIRTQQRKMLRCIAKCHKSFPKSTHSIEDYVEWIQAATEKTDNLMKQFKVQDWIEEQRRRKWKWAEKVASRSDERWTQEIAKWNPDEIKIRGRPKTRWSDEINKYLAGVIRTVHRGSDWIKVAADSKLWRSYEEDFAKAGII